MQYIRFDRLPPRAVFSLNGNACIKKSSRTMWLVDFDRWFYCANNTLCVVGNYSALSADYFGPENTSNGQ